MHNLLEIIKRFIKNNPGLIILNITLMLFLPVNEILIPYCFGKIIANISKASFKVTIAALLCVIIFAQIGMIFRDKINEKLSPKLEMFIKSEMLELILKKYNNVLSDNLSTGEIMYKMSIVPELMFLWIEKFNDFIIPYIFVFTGTFIYFMFFDWCIAMYFFIFIFCLTYILLKTPKTCCAHAVQNDKVFSNLHENIEEVVQNMSAIAGANKQIWEMTRYRKEALEYNTTFIDTTRCYVKAKALIIPIICIFVLCFFIRCRHLLQKRLQNMNTFIPLVSVLSSNIVGCFWLTYMMSTSTFDIGTLTNAGNLLDPYVHVSLPHQYTHAPPFATGIGIKNEKITIHFPENEVTLLVGNNGKGKSTILKKLMGFINEQGTYFNGQWYPSSTIPIEKIREQIGYVPQNTSLFHNTILYNILYGNEDHIDLNVVKEMCTNFGLDPYKNVGKHGMNISGGERQIVWCLRIYFKNTPVIMLDEPTAALDTMNKERLIKLLQLIIRGKTVIIVTHDPDLLNSISRDGKISILNKF